MKPNRTRDKIYQASIKLFLTQGFEDTTLDQITKEAEVAKGTFFNHFTSKDAILSDLCEQMVDAMAKHIQVKLNGVDSARQKLVQLLVLLARFNEKEKQRLKLIVSKLLPLHNEQMQNSIYPAFIQGKIEDIVRDGVKKGEFWKGTNPEHAAHALTGVYLYTTIQWIQAQFLHSLEQMLLHR